jgi:two-component system, NtrC family, response regulator
VIERLTVLSVGDEINWNDLPEFLRQVKPGYEAVQFELPPQGISLEAVEKELILKALKKFDWNQTRAAAFLDISRRTLIYRMEKYGFHRESGEPAAGS